MKKMPVASAAFVLFIVTFLFSGCQKIYDYYVKHPVAEVKKCRIEKMVINDFDIPYTLTFTYNQHNDPTRIVLSANNNQATPDYFYDFYYDNKKRLVEMRQYGNVEQPVIRHFAYNNKNQIVADSFFNDSPHEGYLTEFTYDQGGRIIHDKTTYLYSGAGDTGLIGMRDYVYDAYGNLLPETGSADVFNYDDKLSFLRTNRIWMFLARDYSVNNRQHAIGYNEKYLPLGFNDPVAYFIAGSLFSEITYECRGSSD